MRSKGLISCCQTGRLCLDGCVLYFIMCVSALFVSKGTVHFVFHIMSLWFKYVEKTLFALIHKYEYMNVFPNKHDTVYKAYFSTLKCANSATS